MKLISKLIAALVITGITNTATAQLCDTEDPTNSEQKTFFKTLTKQRSSNWKVSTESDFFLAPLTVHIIRSSAGTGGISVEDWNAALDRMNEQYKPAKIKFYVCGDINFIDDDNLHYYEKNEDRDAALVYAVENTFNLYISDNYTSGGSGSCGFAYYPSLGSPDMSVLATSCVRTGTTLEHELGHAFNLRHTHNGSGSELVARPEDGRTYNCDVNGDGFCDTPADPSLSGWTINYETCEVTNTDDERDAEGYLFQPDGKNVMSYSPSKSCRSIFSPEQYDHMNYIANNHEDWQKMACISLPKADFEVDELVAVAGRSVQLFNRSTGDEISAFNWTFTNATTSSSSIQDPYVTFNSAGNHNVTLRVTNPAGDHEVTIPVQVVDPTPLPINEDFETGSSLLTSNYGGYAASEATIEINGTSGKTGNGLEMFGSESSPPYYVKGQELEKPFLSNPAFTSKFVIPRIDATSYIDLTLSFDAKLFYRSYVCYTNMRVLINGEAISPTYTVASDAAEAWSNYEFDLSTYAGTIFDLTIETNNKYYNNGTYIDNINIDGTLNNVVDFTANKTSVETCELIEFTGSGPASITNFEWDFGDGAIPATASGKGPHSVYYTTSGDKTVTLDGDAGTLTETKINYVSVTPGADQDPTISINANPTGLSCSWSSIDLTSNITNGGSSPTYKWMVNGIEVATTENYSYTDMNDGDVITCELTSDFACALTDKALSNEYTVNIEDGVPYEFYIAEGSYDASYSWEISSGGSSVISSSSPNVTQSISGSIVSDGFCLVEDCYEIQVTNAFGSGGCAVATWDSEIAYTEGMQAEYGGQLYEAKWWTKGNQPDLFSGPSDQWLLIGECESTVPTDVYGLKIQGQSAFFEEEVQTYSSPETHAFGGSLTPTLSISNTESFPVCIDGSVDFTSDAENIGTATISWYINDVLQTTGTDFNIASPVNGDVVTAKVTSDLSCAAGAGEITSNEIEMTVDLCTGFDELSKDWSVYPIPTNGNLTINSSENTNIQILDIQGKLFFQGLTSAETENINLANLNPGIYFVKLELNGQNKHIKIIKK